MNSTRSPVSLEGTIAVTLKRVAPSMACAMMELRTNSKSKLTSELNCVVSCELVTDLGLVRVQLRQMAQLLVIDGTRSTTSLWAPAAVRIS